MAASAQAGNPDQRIDASPLQASLTIGGRLPLGDSERADDEVKQDSAEERFVGHLGVASVLIHDRGVAIGLVVPEQEPGEVDRGGSPADPGPVEQDRFVIEEHDVVEVDITVDQAWVSCTEHLDRDRVGCP
jgi:hypothetical protein